MRVTARPAETALAGGRGISNPDLGSLWEYQTVKFHGASVLVVIAVLVIGLGGVVFQFACETRTS
jgi:hypothetical protein